jgi:hypothetical protein
MKFLVPAGICLAVLFATASFAAIPAAPPLIILPTVDPATETEPSRDLCRQLFTDAYFRTRQHAADETIKIYYLNQSLDAPQSYVTAASETVSAAKFHVEFFEETRNNNWKIPDTDRRFEAVYMCFKSPTTGWQAEQVSLTQTAPDRKFQRSGP